MPDDTKINDGIPRAHINKAAWRALAIACAVLTLSLVAVLLAQAGLWNGGLQGDDPDPLTTLALVLAILAFFVQIFVFVFQGNASNSAVLRSEELNADTQKALNKIEANSSATQQVLFAQFDRLLDYVVDPAQIKSSAPDIGSPEARLDEEDGDSGAASLTPADIERLVSEGVAKSMRRPTFSGTETSTEEDREVIAYLQSWPSADEARELVPRLMAFSPRAISMLTRFAHAEVDQRLNGKPVGLTYTKLGTGTEQLIEAGLLNKGEKRLRLTEKGRAYARLLPIGKANEAPDDVQEILEPLAEPQRSKR